MDTNFNIGDLIVYNYEGYDYIEGKIFHQDYTGEIIKKTGSSMFLVRLDGFDRGHNGDTGFDRRDFWWVNVSELRFAENETKYTKICRKVRSMNDRRKELGYAF